MNTKETIKNHLEFLGYEVMDNIEDSIICRRNGYSGILIRRTESYISLFGKYNINELAKNNTADFLSYINRLNCQSSISTFYLDEDNEFCFASIYTGSYDKKLFAEYLEQWENDTCHRLDRIAETDRVLVTVYSVSQSRYETNISSCA